MALRVISTKLSEEEHNKVLEICKKTDCNLSSFLKDCIVDLVEKEAHKIERPTEETINMPDFSPNNDKKTGETKIAPKIRYQYF